MATTALSGEHFHAWWRPSPLPRRRRKPWVRVTACPVTRAEAWEAAHAHAALQGGGDLRVVESWKNPNDDPEPR